MNLRKTLVSAAVLRAPLAWRTRGSSRISSQSPQSRPCLVVSQRSSPSCRNALSPSTDLGFAALIKYRKEADAAKDQANMMQERQLGR